MTTEAESGPEPSHLPNRPSRIRRVGVAIALVLVVLVAATAVLGGIGYHQRDRLTAWGAARFLDTPVSVTGLSIGRDAIRIRSLALYDDADAAPTVLLEGIELAYTLQPADGRFFPTLHIDAAALYLDGSDPADTSCDFITAFLARPVSDIDPMLFIPRHTTVETLRLDAATPDWSLSLGQVGLDASVDALDQMVVMLTGEAIDVMGASAWTGPLSETPREGRLQFRVERDGTRVTVASDDFTIPDLAHVIGSGTIDWNDRRIDVDGFIKTLELPGPLAAALLDLVSPERVRLDRMYIDELRVAAVIMDGGPMAYTFNGDAAIEALRVGPDDARYYESDLTLTGAFDESGGEATLHLGRGQSMVVDIAEGFPDAPATITLADWSRADLIDALPTAYRAYVEQVPAFDGIESLTANAGRTEDHWSGNLDGVFRMPDGEHRLVIAVQMPPAEAAASIAAEGMMQLPGAGSPIRITGEVEPTGEAELYLAIDTLHSDRLAPWLPPDTLPPGYHALVTGAIVLTRSDEAFFVDADLQSAETVLAESELLADQPIQAQGRLGLAFDPTQVAGPELVFDVGDWLQGTVADWALQLAPLDITGRLDAAVDFYSIPSTILTGVLGEAWLRGPFRYHDGILETDIAVEGEGLSYGAWMPPGETRMGITASVALDTNRKMAAIQNLVATWNDGSRLTSESFELHLEPTAFSMPFALQTDLTPLADLALINAVTGGDATGRGTLIYEGEALQIDARAIMRSDTLAVLDNLFALVNVEGDGRMAYDDEGLDGAGTFRADEAAAFGGVLRPVHAQWEATGDRILLPSLDAMLFGGRLVGTAAVDMLGDDRTGSFEARLDRLDLARFTQEYEPPEIRLTGTASGTIRVDWNAEGIQDLHLDLAAPDGCTINRDLLERLFVAQLTQGLEGQRQFRIIREQVLGEATDRPFDSLELTLDWDDGRYYGILALKSAALNLTLDLRIDAEAVSEVMRLRQDAQLEDLADIRLQ